MSAKKITKHFNKWIFHLIFQGKLRAVFYIIIFSLQYIQGIR